MRHADHSCFHVDFSATPSSQKTSAQTQNASMSTSHISVVAETKKSGANKTSSATSSGRVQNCCASRHVPQTTASAGNRKAVCKPTSLQPKISAANARK